MRLLSIFLVLAILMGLAGAQDTFYGGLVGSNPIGYIAVQTIPAAETSDTDQIKAASVNSFNSTTHFVLTNAGAGSSLFLAQPDVPRNIIGTMNTSTTGSLKITGTDISGAVITENLTWAGETGAKSGLKAFKTVTRVDGTCTTNTAQFLLGVGNVLGLNSLLARNTVFEEFVNGARETTAGTVTTSSTVLSLNTIDSFSAPGGYVTVVCYVTTTR